MAQDKEQLESANVCYILQVKPSLILRMVVVCMG